MRDKSNVLITILVSLGLYLISTGITYAGFSFFAPTGGLITSPVPKVSPSGKAKNKVNPNLPKDSACPLNGVKNTKLEEEDWKKGRPLPVMIENSED